MNARPAALSVLLAALGLAGGAGGCARPAARAEPAPPAVAAPVGAPAPRPLNFIVVDVDTLRADRLSCYGNPRPTSPAMDALAARGVRFEWALSQAPYTPPSQSSILSGLYPASHGVYSRHDRLPAELTTLAEALQAAGWATGGFADGGYMSRGFGLEQGFETYLDQRGGLAVLGPPALAWLREQARDPAGRPFFLFVHTYDVHTPYDPPRPYRSLFLDGLEPKTRGFEPTAYFMETVRGSLWSGNTWRLPPNDLAYSLALYDAGIRYVDAWMARLRRELVRQDLVENTVVVLISDHGEEFQEHGSVLHEKLYATVNRIPLIFAGSGIQPGRVVGDVVESIDLMPTLLELAGVAPPPGLQGTSLVPYFTGGRPAGAAERAAFAESPHIGHQLLVARGDYRLHYRVYLSYPELFAFRRDPHELDDLAADRPEEVAALRRELVRWKRLVAQHPPPSQRTSLLTAETLQQLRSLGYLQ